MVRYGGASARFAVIAVWLCWISASTTIHADEWAVGAFLGEATTSPNTLKLQQTGIGTNLTLNAVRYDSHSFESPVYYGYRVTWFARRHLGLEGEFIHPKVFARRSEPVRATGTLAGHPLNGSVPFSSIIQRFSISHGLNFVLVNGVIRHQLGRTSTPRLWVTVRGGSGITIPHTESDIGGRVQEQYERGAAAVQGALGGEIRLADHFSATIDYKLTTTNQAVSVPDGTIRGRFTSHHAAVGVTWRP